MIRFISLASLVTLTAAACAAPENTAADAHQSLGKPGAAIGFSHTLQSPVSPGGAGVLTLSINERYDAGQLAISVASSGLDLATASQSTTLSLSGASPHQWDVFFDAPDSGVYYIDFTAAVTDANGVTSSRSYSAAVQIGDGATLSKPDANVARDADGNPVMIMEAEETIDE